MRQKLMVSATPILFIVFYFGFCNTIFAASSLKEVNRLRGPLTEMDICGGADVGRATIEHKDLDLAQKIVGKVFNKDKSTDRITVSVIARDIQEDRNYNVYWISLDTPGVCDFDMVMPEDLRFLGRFRTDENGWGRGRFRLEEGNPVPGKGVVLFVCRPGQISIPGGFCNFTEPAFTSLFESVFPPNP